MNDNIKLRPNDKFGGKREWVICGRISLNLLRSVRKLIDGTRFHTINDFVEEAIWDKVKQVEKEKTEGGC